MTHDTNNTTFPRPLSVMDAEIERLTVAMQGKIDRALAARTAAQRTRALGERVLRALEAPRVA